MFRNVFEPPRHVDPNLRQHRAEKFVIVSPADHPAAFDWQVPRVADVPVLIRQPLRILAGFTDEGRRCDDTGVARSTRCRLVHVKRVVVADREREVANRGAADLIGRRVAYLAPYPSPKLLRQERAISSALRFVRAPCHGAGITASESTSIRYSGRSRVSHTHPVEAGNGARRITERTPATSR